MVWLIAFLCGAVVMALEILGARILQPYFGSGILTWASLIAVFLAAMSGGYFLGGWLADRFPTLRAWAFCCFWHQEASCSSCRWNDGFSHRRRR